MVSKNYIIYIFDYIISEDPSQIIMLIRILRLNLYSIYFPKAMKLNCHSKA